MIFLLFCALLISTTTSQSYLELRSIRTWFTAQHSKQSFNFSTHFNPFGAKRLPFSFRWLVSLSPYCIVSLVLLYTTMTWYNVCFAKQFPFNKSRSPQFSNAIVSSVHSIPIPMPMPFYLQFILNRQPLTTSDRKSKTENSGTEQWCPHRNSSFVSVYLHIVLLRMNANKVK